MILMCLKMGVIHQNSNFTRTMMIKHIKTSNLGLPYFQTQRAGGHGPGPGDFRVHHWRDPTCFTCSAGAEVAGDAQVHPSIPCHREMSSRVCCTWCRPQFGEGTFWATWADWEMRLGGCFEVTFLEIWKVRPHLKTRTWKNSSDSSH